MRYLLLLFSLFVTHFSFGQNRELDSLSSFVKNYSREDTIKVNALNALSNQYQWMDFDLSLQYAEQSSQEQEVKQAALSG